MEDPLGVRTASNDSLSLHFSENRQVEGSTPCGSFDSAYSIRHEAMTIEQGPRLPEDCQRFPWEPMVRNYYVALNDVVRHQVAASRLTLTSATDTKMVFEEVGPKCASPKPVAGEIPSETINSGINVRLSTSDPIDTLINRLEAEYADLQLLVDSECRQADVGVTVNRVTLEYLRCRNDITAISYF